MNLYERLRQVVNEARAAGYCVIIWTPEELKSVDIDDLESVSTARGNDLISDSTLSQQ